MEASGQGIDVLNELRGGGQATLDRLMPIVYDHPRLGVTARTVQRDWVKTRTLLRRVLT
jgi:hypothetical protein